MRLCMVILRTLTSTESEKEGLGRVWLEGNLYNNKNALATMLRTECRRSGMEGDELGRPLPWSRGRKWWNQSGGSEGCKKLNSAYSLKQRNRICSQAGSPGIFFIWITGKSCKWGFHLMRWGRLNLGIECIKFNLLLRPASKGVKHTFGYVGLECKVGL